MIKIILVDDEAKVRSMIAKYLESRFDCSVQEVSDGDAAIDYIKEKPCDIMLLDIKMPKKGGMQVIKESKAVDPNMEILVISAWADEDVAEEALRLGATDYALKPVDLKVIEHKFNNIMKKRQEKG